MKSGGILEIENQESGNGATAPLLLILLATLIAGLLTPTPTLGGVDSKVLDVCHKSTDAAFRAKYCSAAKDLRHGYNANLATSAVWTAVSVTCGMSCGKAIGGITCKVAGYAGTAGEGIITKKFTDAIGAEGSKWGGNAASNDSGTVPTTGNAATGADGTVAAAGPKVNADACESAGKGALKAFEKFSNSKQNDKSLTDLRDQTKGMDTPKSQNQVGFAGDTQNSGDSNGASTSAATTGKNEICGDGAIKTALGAIRCAASADPSLPPYVKSEEFVKDIQKATGKSADTFFAGFESPAKAIFDSPLVNGMPEGQQRALADSLTAMEGYSDARTAKVAALSPPPLNGGYAGKSAAHVAAEDDTGFDMNGMIANVLGQVGGKADGENDPAPNSGGTGATERRPASGNSHAAEDRTISIFDRVQSRYGAVSARDRLGVP